MARPLRVHFPGAIYHVTNRLVGSWSGDQARLFQDTGDYQRFLDRLAELVEQFRIRLYLYCLMTNHYHLVCETPEDNLAEFIQTLATAYSIYFNLRHKRHGHLFDGRYKAKLVEGDDYLLALSRYVHLNPVFADGWEKKPLAERIQHLRAYRWSSYPSYIGLAKPSDFVDYAPVLAEQGGPRKDWPKRYREFVETGLTETDAEFVEALRASPRSIGSSGFRAWIDGLHQELLAKHARPEDVSFRRVTEPLTAQEVLGVVAAVFEVEVQALRERRRSSALRAVAARFLVRYAGLSERAVAAQLGMKTGSAVSWHVRRSPAVLAPDRHLRRLTRQAEARLEVLHRQQSKREAGK